MVEKKQTMRYTDAEMSIIKNTFADNDDLLKTLRKFFLQMPLDVVDQQNLISIKANKELTKVIRKSFLPNLDPYAPINQVIDLWLTVDIKEKKPLETYPIFLARSILIKYLDEHLAVLEGSLESSAYIFESLTDMQGKEITEIYSNIVARNNLVSHTEMQITQFSILAGLKDETVEKTVQRLKKDSSK